MHWYVYEFDRNYWKVGSCEELFELPSNIRYLGEGPEAEKEAGSYAERLNAPWRD